MDSIVKSSDGNIELSYDVANVSTAISFYCSFTVLKQFLCHGFELLTDTRQIRWLLSTVAKRSHPRLHCGFPHTRVTVDSYFAINIHRNLFNVKNLITIHWSILTQLHPHPLFFNWMPRSYARSYHTFVCVWSSNSKFQHKGKQSFSLTPQKLGDDEGLREKIHFICQTVTNRANTLK